MYRTIEKCEEYLKKGIPEKIFDKIVQYLNKKYGIEEWCFGDGGGNIILIDKKYNEKPYWNIKTDEETDGANEPDEDLEDNDYTMYKRLEINGEWKGDKYLFENYIENLQWRGSWVGYWNGKKEELSAEELQELIINAYGGNQRGNLRRRKNNQWADIRFGNSLFSGSVGNKAIA